MMKIYCPKCNWTPQKQTRWRCFCGHNFDPFEDVSRCPSCQYCHEFTECQNENCRQITPHLSWYEGVEKNVSRLIFEAKVSKKTKSHPSRKS